MHETDAECGPAGNAEAGDHEAERSGQRDKPAKQRRTADRARQRHAAGMQQRYGERAAADPEPRGQPADGDGGRALVRVAKPAPQQEIAAADEDRQRREQQTQTVAADLSRDNGAGKRAGCHQRGPAADDVTIHGAAARVRTGRHERGQDDDGR